MWALFARELFDHSAAMHKLRPLEVVFDEAIQRRCCNFNICAICELDRHSRLLKGFSFDIC
jgi:hypothetical protein